MEIIAGAEALILPGGGRGRGGARQPFECHCRRAGVVGVEHLCASVPGHMRGVVDKEEKFARVARDEFGYEDLSREG